MCFQLKQLQCQPCTYSWCHTLRALPGRETPGSLCAESNHTFLYVFFLLYHRPHEFPEPKERVPVGAGQGGHCPLLGGVEGDHIHILLLGMPVRRVMLMKVTSQAGFGGACLSSSIQEASLGYRVRPHLCIAIIISAGVKPMALSLSANCMFASYCIRATGLER